MYITHRDIRIQWWIVPLFWRKFAVFPSARSDKWLPRPINDYYNSKQAFIELMQNGDAGWHCRLTAWWLFAMDESALFRPTKRTKFNRSIESAWPVNLIVVIVQSETGPRDVVHVRSPSRIIKLLNDVSLSRITNTFQVAGKGPCTCNPLPNGRGYQTVN